MALDEYARKPTKKGDKRNPFPLNRKLLEKPKRIPRKVPIVPSTDQTSGNEPLSN